MQPKICCIDATSRSLPIDVRQAAILVIDMQNDFGAPGGMMDLAGRDISVIRNLIPPIQRILGIARAQAIPVIYLKMAHRPDLSDAGLPDSPHWLRHSRLLVGQEVVRPGEQRSRILIDGMWGTEIIPELSPAPGDIVITKHRYSGFFETDLDLRLRERGIKSLIVTGCTTSVCVESTVRDAMARDYACLVLADAVGQPWIPGMTSSAHESSLHVIQAVFGHVSTTEAFAMAVEATGSTNRQPECSGRPVA